MTSVKKLSRRTSYRCGRSTGASSVNSDVEGSSGENNVQKATNELRDNLTEKLEIKLMSWMRRLMPRLITDLSQCFENSLAIIKAENVDLRKDCEVLKNKVKALQEN
ncbi:hypothetical protein J6590_030513 [Homalodisca vitripennis]|nr:hypothetical protein J6590_030513 [Homalodisca vitripennis]